MAACGEVGLAAIQTARLVGAVPIATVRGASKRQALLDVCAAHDIDSENEDLVAASRRSRAATASGLPSTLSTGMFTMFRVTWAPEHGCAARSRSATRGLSDGALAPVVDNPFDLGDVAEAHRYMESNAQTGKIVLTVDHGTDAA
ncbi:zinc-binding dehydrogenase [Streptomyces sp. 2131.1]|uniref:zinc-binding dehydrogenase n=1 Tax=Streptomyces sp. 2131.1 TaxID=1855346 RepID=UPI000A69E761|nr:zinc-binding dehydrogenase [Streptomyces sp. 2131.1]